MKKILQSSVNLFLSFVLLSCGSHTKGNDPLPLAPKPGTVTSGPGYPVSPTVVAPRLPETKPLPTVVDNAPIDSTPLANIPVLGSPETFEIGTWNIENYPKSPGSRAMVSKILNQLDIDVMAVQEISGETAFKALVATMPKFGGILASESAGPASGQNVGFIYRKADFSLVQSEALFTRDIRAFPRPPLLVRLRSTKPEATEIVAISVHLKAFGDEANQERRAEANILLEQYVSDLKAREPKLQIVVLGDFNQPLIEDAERKVFDPWFNKGSNYTVKTDSLVGKGDYSYFSSRFSLIDHMIATHDFNLAEPTIVKLQNLVPNYLESASDHLPVICRQTLTTPPPVSAPAL